jgi:hypothetical protein
MATQRQTIANGAKALETTGNSQLPGRIRVMDARIAFRSLAGASLETLLKLREIPDPVWYSSAPSILPFGLHHRQPRRILNRNQFWKPNLKDILFGIYSLDRNWHREDASKTKPIFACAHLERQAKPPVPPRDISSLQARWDRLSACLDFCHVLRGEFQIEKSWAQSASSGSIMGAVPIYRLEYCIPSRVSAWPNGPYVPHAKVVE